MKTDTTKLLELCEKAIEAEANDHHTMSKARVYAVTVATPETVQSLCTELDRARELLESALPFVEESGSASQTATTEIRAYLTGQDDKRGGV